MATDAKDIREAWRFAEECDRKNREEALVDLKFRAGEQWDPAVKRWREARGVSLYGVPLPCMTLPMMSQLVSQVVGQRRSNETMIKVIPAEDGDQQIAELRSDLMRAIQVRSRATRHFDIAFDNAVSCGVGWLRVDLDWAKDTSFDKDLFIRSIANPLSVLADPLSVDPTGRDMKWGFVADRLMKDDFAKQYKDAAPLGEFDMNQESDGWLDAETVRVAEYWTLIEKPRTLALMKDGTVQDITDEKSDKWKKNAFDDGNGPRVRKAPVTYARRVMTNGIEQLDDPFELQVPRLPLVRMSGEEVWVGDSLRRFGMIRKARDAQLMKNFYRSVVAEKLMFAPRQNFIASESAMKGRDEDYPNVLIYNDGSPPPTYTATMDLAALAGEAQMCAQDMKDVTGIHEASLGMNGNETSGVAITARVHQGEISTMAYNDNANAALEEVGEILNALIPVVYDTARTVRTIGADQAVKLVKIAPKDDPKRDPQALDITHGSYDVVITVGPETLTKRQEAAQSMMAFMQAMGPQVGIVIGDLVADAQDWPNADQIAERLKLMLPPPIQQAIQQQQQQGTGGAPQQGQPGVPGAPAGPPDAGPPPMDPHALQQMLQNAIAEQRLQLMQEAGARAELRLKMAQADKAEADARAATANADRSEATASKEQSIASQHGAETAIAGAVLAHSGINADQGASVANQGGIL